MDLLIDLVVGLLRALFGDTTESDDTLRPKRPMPPTQSSNQRGPYQYGDEPPAQAKTLEEILEEVRQAAAQRRGQTAGPPPLPRPGPPPVPSQPQPRPVTRAGQRKRAERSRAASRPEPEMLQPAAQELTSAPPAAPLEATPLYSDVAMGEALTALQPAAEQVSAEAAPPASAALAGVAGVTGIAELVAPAEAAAAPAKSAVAQAAGLPPGIAGLLNALLQAAPEQRQDAARQAMVLHEIFGPPRSRRPYRPGARAS
ncbi:MAG: hypothetical protein ABSE73_09255 [Planctomycetota bacterium]